MKKSKMTNEEIIHAKKTKLPPKFIYNVLGRIWQMLFVKKYGVKVDFKYDFRKEKGPCFVISNHASRADYIFTGVPLLPNCYNYVAGYNEFYRSHLRGVFNLLQIIPKKNFVPDIYTIKEINRVINNGGKIVIFPEGMSSIGGMNQPVALGTGKLLKHYKIPVYFSKIQGGYLTTPKYSNDDRYGEVHVTFDRMFTPDELNNLSVEEIEDIINKKLYHDDYAWNLEKKIEYKNKGNIATNLHHLLYWCPKCNEEYTMLGKGNVIQCQSCGNGATLDDTYKMTPLDRNDIIPKTQSEWFNMQRDRVKEQIKDENFSYSIKVDLGVLPKKGLLKDNKTSNIVGKGVATINRQGFTYKGTRDGEEIEMFIPSKDLPTYGMCTDVTRFYTFYKGEFVEFYPEINRVEKFFMITEEMHRINGGKWQDFKFTK